MLRNLSDVTMFYVGFTILCAPSIASPGVPPPPPPPGDHRGFDRFALPGVGNLTRGGLRGRDTLTDASLHCDLHVYRVGLFDHFVCPRGGDLGYI